MEMLASSAIFLLCFQSLLFSVLSFNVDTKNPLIFKGPPNSYFGYSVAILENSQGTWLLVGAPRANDTTLTNVYQPGAVFQCNWQYRSSCQYVFIDNIGNEKQTFPKWKKVNVHHQKDNQWLGASIDVNVDGDLRVMVCAPRWRDQRFSVQGHLLMNGLCYEVNSELNFQESSAWPVLEYWKKQIHDDNYYVYGMGSLGTSIAYSKDGKFSVLGAPGLNDWAGGFASIGENPTDKPRILDIPADNHNDSYYGMSITTARLSADDLSIVVGGPRAGDHGKVMAYNNKFQLLFVKEGEQLGSYFGAALCAADVNGDGLDDLIVGVPLYTKIKDEGQVVVYINNEFFDMKAQEPLSGSGEPGARFGTAVVNLGDLNLDLYEDIAVGAPYEEESGVVYIFNGGKSGLYTKPSQRIVGKDLSEGLKAFGFSFSRPWDVDGNHYGDFAVGSFESDKVVLLLTRSVLDLHAKLELHPNSIVVQDGTQSCEHRGRKLHCFMATVCLKYSGRNLPPLAEVNVTLTLDILERHRNERSRLFILDDKGNELDKVNELFTVVLERDTCEKSYKVFLRPSRDVLTPLKVELDYDIASDSTHIASMCALCPVRNMYNPSVLHESVYFINDCGTDNICHPDMTVSVEPKFKNNDDYLVINNNPEFDLDITVSNKGEISHFTMVTMKYPTTLVFAFATLLNMKNSVTCVPPEAATSNSSLSVTNCDILRPLQFNRKVTLRARFYTKSIPYDLKTVSVDVKVSSVSAENASKLQDNTAIANVAVHVESDLEFIGLSMPSQIALKGRDHEEEEVTKSMTFSHMYVLHNFGPSPLPHGQLTLSVPYAEEIHLIGVHINTKSLAGADAHIPVECSITSPDKTGSLQENDVKARKDKFDDRIAYLSCEHLECSTVTCYIGLVNNMEGIFLNMTMSVNVDILDYVESVNQLIIISSGVLEEPDYMSYYSMKSTHNTSSATYVVHDWSRQQRIAWWILIISIASGLLLLYAVTILLWKCGFFKRKKRDQLLKIIQSVEAERQLLHSDSPSASSSDIMVPPTPPRSSINGSTFGRSISIEENPMDEDYMDYSLSSRKSLVHSSLLGHRNVGQNGAPFFASTTTDNFPPGHHERRDMHSPRDHRGSRDFRDSNDPHGSREVPYHHHTYSLRNKAKEADICAAQIHGFNSLRPNGYRRGRCGIYANEPSAFERPQHAQHQRFERDRNNDIWVTPSASTATAPAFNNEMYLEPFVSRA